ncbi:MAG: DUF58 domain-containing protein [Myxococcales bacterium]|nr:DUF58 domain-containing protein [Myxococcales bacterium]
MGWFDRWRRARQVETARAELFDETFQRRLEYLQVAARRLFAGRLRAERKTRKAGSGLEFAAHREYTAGDDLRALDWNVYARSERLLLKQFEEEEDLTIAVLVDCSGSMLHGPAKFDHARRLAAALAYVGLANLDRVALYGVNTRVLKRLPPARGKGQIFKVFDFLRGLECGGETALADAGRSFGAEQKRRGVAIVVSDLYDPQGFERGINALRYQKFEPLVVHVIDPDDRALDEEGDLVLVDVEDGHAREVTLTEAMRRRFGEVHAAWCAEVEAFCKARQIAYAPARVDQPFEDQVLTLFRRMGLVG